MERPPRKRARDAEAEDAWAAADREQNAPPRARRGTAGGGVAAAALTSAVVVEPFAGPMRRLQQLTEPLRFFRVVDVAADLAPRAGSRPFYFGHAEEVFATRADDPGQPLSGPRTLVYFNARARASGLGVRVGPALVVNRPFGDAAAHDAPEVGETLMGAVEVEPPRQGAYGGGQGGGGSLLGPGGAPRPPGLRLRNWSRHAEPVRNLKRFLTVNSRGSAGIYAQRLRQPGAQAAAAALAPGPAAFLSSAERTAAAAAAAHVDDLVVLARVVLLRDVPLLAALIAREALGPDAQPSATAAAAGIAPNFSALELMSDMSRTLDGGEVAGELAAAYPHLVPQDAAPLPAAAPDPAVYVPLHVEPPPYSAAWMPMVSYNGSGGPTSPVYNSFQPTSPVGDPRPGDRSTNSAAPLTPDYAAYITGGTTAAYDACSGSGAPAPTGASCTPAAAANSDATQYSPTAPERVSRPPAAQDGAYDPAPPPLPAPPAAASTLAAAPATSLHQLLERVRARTTASMHRA